MPFPNEPSILFHGTTFAWPDGSAVLRDTNASFGSGRTGLTGANGAGKSTLLRLITGDLKPVSGTITVGADLGYLPQHLTLATGATLADLLGIRAPLHALHAIEAGDPAVEHFDVLGDAWDIETRAEEALRSVGLDALDLDRSVRELSGGETILAALSGLRLAGTPIVLLDEPTNNLDRSARHRLYTRVQSWKGTLIVVSHDTALLDLMDDTAELRNASLTVFGGGFSAYRQYLAAEQEAAERALRSAEQVLRTEKRQRIEAETKLARRSRYAQTDYENKRMPKIVMNLRRSEAQVSAGKLRTEFDGKVTAAGEAVDERGRQVRRNDHIRIQLPDPHVAAGRRLAELSDGERTVTLQGPERVALTGPNGVGKTRLLESLMRPDMSLMRPDEAQERVVAVPLTERIGYLPQRLDTLDDAASVLENVRAGSPGTAPNEVRAKLARFLFRGDTVDRAVAGLSGGERFRVALAKLLLADPPAQLLVLDEPTNSLDLASVDQLIEALEDYRGALLVVSHDDAFLDRLGITRWLSLDRDGRLGTGRP